MATRTPARRVEEPKGSSSPDGEALPDWNQRLMETPGEAGCKTRLIEGSSMRTAGCPTTSDNSKAVSLARSSPRRSHSVRVNRSRPERPQRAVGPQGSSLRAESRNEGGASAVPAIGGEVNRRRGDEANHQASAGG